MKQLALLLCLLSWTLGAAGQNLSGHWVGGLPQDDKTFVFLLEMDIQQKGKNVVGQSKITSTTGEWAKMSFEGEVLGHTIYLEEKEVLQATDSRDFAWCIKLFTGEYQVSDNRVFINGKWRSKAMYQNGRYTQGDCVPGVFSIRKALPSEVEVPKSVTLGPEVAPTKRPLKANEETVTLKNVLFEQTKAVLLPASQPELNQLVQVLSAHPRWQLVIEGHTDKIGEQAKNLLLSQQRAQAIKTYLIAHGIGAARIKTAGYGDTRPVCPSPCEANRRVEFTLVK